MRGRNEDRAPKSESSFAVATGVESTPRVRNEVQSAFVSHNAEPAQTPPACVQEKHAFDSDEVSRVVQALHHVTGIQDAPSLDESLVDYGLDSLAMMELIENISLPDSSRKIAEPTLRNLLEALHGAAETSSAPEKSHESKGSAAASFLQWVWPKPFDEQMLMRHLTMSIERGQFTNNGPATLHLEQQAWCRMKLLPWQKCIACCNGTAALHALVATYEMAGKSLSRGILVSPFGFPPILQQNWTPYVKLVDMDPLHGGPKLPSEDQPPPSVICIVNPFGYRVDIQYYRAYCDTHHVELWMDNAATPLHFLPDGSNLLTLADAAMVSMHETKPIGRGEGGLLIVPEKLAHVARRAIAYGFDVSLPADQRQYDPRASNWKMCDFAAAAILMHWDLAWDSMVSWLEEHDDEVMDCPPFRRGGKGSLVACLMEQRQDRPDRQVMYYYKPLAPREAAPEVWAFYDRMQCTPFHPEDHIALAKWAPAFDCCPPKIRSPLVLPTKLNREEILTEVETTQKMSFGRKWRDEYCKVQPLNERDDMDAALRQVGKTVGGHPVDSQVLTTIVNTIMHWLQIEPTDLVLDLGCGNGLITSRVARSCAHITGVDISPAMIESAQHYFATTNSTYTVGDITEICAFPALWKDASKVFAYEVLQYVTREELLCFLRNMAVQPAMQKLFFGGVPDWEHRRNFFNTQERWEAHVADQRQGGMNDPLGKWWTREELEDVALLSGFRCTIVKQRPELYTSHYRFDVLFERDVQVTPASPSSSFPAATGINSGADDSTQTRVVIFGDQQLAQLAHRYLEEDSQYVVVAFTVHKRYRASDTCAGKPLVDFEALNQLYPPANHSLFAPMTGRQLNQVRKQVYQEGLARGYSFISYVSSKANVMTNHIGDNCFILEGNNIQPFAKIGSNVIMWSGNHIGHHSTIGDHVFITSHVVVAGNVTVGEFSWLGVNSGIADNVSLGEGTVVGMGSVVSTNTNSNTLYMGNPARARGPSNIPQVMRSL